MSSPEEQARIIAQARAIAAARQAAGQMPEIGNAINREVERAQADNALRDRDAYNAAGAGTPPAPQGGVTVNPEAVQDFQNRASAMGQGAAHGFTLGFSDEIRGVAGAIDPRDTYSEARDRSRESLETAREEYPGAAWGGEILGGAGIGLLAGAPLQTAIQAGRTTLGARALSGALAGGIEGGVYGFGQGEGIEDRARGAMLGATGGAAVGGALPVMGEAAQRFALRPMAGALGINNSGRAANAIVRALEDAGLGPDDVDSALTAAGREGQSVFTVADALGASGRRTLAGVSTQPGPGRQLAYDVLEPRQANQSERLGTFVREAYGADDTAAQQRAASVLSRSDDAGLNYAAAEASAGPVNLTAAMRTADDLLGRDPVIGETSSLSQGPLGRRIQAFRDRMANDTDQAIGFRDVLGMRTDLREFMEQNPRASAALRPLYDDLTTALSDASPDFAAANRAYRDASEVIEAVDTGRASNRPTTRSADVRDTYEGLGTDDARQAFRVGYADADLARIEGATYPRNMARQLFMTDRARANADLLADDTELFLRRVAREDAMSETANTALRGSQTAANLADQAAVDGEDIGIITNLLANRPGVAIGQLAARGYNAARGLNEPTRLAIARALLASDPGAIGRAIAPAQRNAAVDRMVGALMRGTTRTPTYQATEAMAR